MKRIFNIIAGTVALFAITACEDVPAPYELQLTDTQKEGVYAEETFATSFGAFIPVTIKGTSWVIDYSTAKATGWDGTSTTESEAYLISPALDLTESQSAYLTFEYILRYKSSSPCKVLLSLDYDDVPANVGTATWRDITGDLTEGSDWNTFYTYGYQLPEDVIGQANVHVALYYSCNNSKSITWEVKNLAVKEGKFEGEGNGNGDDPTPPVVEGQYINETFESSFGVFQPKTTKGTPWIIDFKTAKASGYDNASKTTTASESYLVATVDLSASKAAHIKFDYILRYVSEATSTKVLLSDNYAGDPTTATWTDITGKLTEGTDWTTFSNYANAVPAEFIGKPNVTVALYYSCTTNSCTWEVKNFVMAEGEVNNDTPNTPDTPDTPGNVRSDMVIDLSTFGFENAADVTNITKDGVTLTFAQEGGTNAPKYYTATNGVRMYALNSLTIAADKKVVAVKLECDTYQGTDYVGNPTLYAEPGKAAVSGTSVIVSEVNNNTVKIVNHHTEAKAGVQLRIKKVVLQFEGEGNPDTPDTPDTPSDVTGDLLIDLSTFGYENAADVTTITTEGVTLTFAQEDGTNAPKYYTATNGVRMYAKNSLTIAAGNKIASVKLECDSYSGTDYVGNSTLYAEPGKAAVSGTNVIVSDVDNATVKIVNDHIENKGGVQLRIKKVAIEYAK